MTLRHERARFALCVRCDTCHRVYDLAPALVVVHKPARSEHPFRSGWQLVGERTAACASCQAVPHAFEMPGLTGLMPPSRARRTAHKH
jgi:hypothetical protein